jgi:hypothetical protein
MQKKQMWFSETNLKFIDKHRWTKSEKPDTLHVVCICDVTLEYFCYLFSLSGPWWVTSQVWHVCTEQHTSFSQKVSVLLSKCPLQFEELSCNMLFLENLWKKLKFWSFEDVNPLFGLVDSPADFTLAWSIAQQTLLWVVMLTFYSSLPRWVVQWVV